MNQVIELDFFKMQAEIEINAATNSLDKMLIEKAVKSVLFAYSVGKVSANDMPKRLKAILIALGLNN